MARPEPGELPIKIALKSYGADISVGGVDVSRSVLRATLDIGSAGHRLILELIPDLFTVEGLAEVETVRTGNVKVPA